MKFEYTLIKTLFGFIISFTIQVISIYILISEKKITSEAHAMFLSSAVLLTPITIWTLVLLYKMWKRKTTKIIEK